MKLKQNMRLIFAIFFVATLATAAYSMVVVSAQDEVEELPFGGFYMIADGDFEPNLSLLQLESMYGINIPDDVFHSNQPWEIPVLKTYGNDFAITKVFSPDGHSIRVGFHAVLEAPVIDIWTTEEDQGSDYSISLSNEDMEAATVDDDTSELSWGLLRMLGDLDYLYENTTDVDNVEWTFDTTFAIASYDILIVDGMKSKGNSGNVSITVSYSNSSSAPTNYNSTYVHNETIFNDFASLQEAWFRLDLENTNSSYSTHVNHIQIDNIEADGIYIAEADANVSDTRYTRTYFGDRDDFITTSSIDDSKHNWGILTEPRTSSDEAPISYGGGPSPDGLSLSSFWSSATGSKIASLSSSIKGTADNVINEARGWDTKDKLENAFKDRIIQKDPDYTERSQIKDLKLTNAVANWDIPQKITELKKAAYDKYKETESSVKQVVEKAKEETVKRVTFATDLAADAVNKGKEAAEDALDATNALAGSIKDRASAFGQDVKNKITDAAGTIKDGAVSVWSNAKQKLQEIGSFLQRYLPFILIGAGLIILLVAFMYLRNMGMLAGMAFVGVIDLDTKFDTGLRRVGKILERYNLEDHNRLE